MEIITKIFESEKGVIKVHGIRTGKLAIKKSALSSNNPGLLSTILSFTDKEFGEWLPIWSWLIEHSEGLFLIDTGLSIDIKQKNYFNKLDFISKFYFEKQMKFKIEEAEEINNQLNKIGIDCSSISKIILTHLHIDHTGGLKHFPKISVLVNKREWETQDGSFPQLFPKNTKFETIELENQFECFENSYFLTNKKDLVIVETQGHTRGHSSIVLKLNENKFVFFAGDVTYNVEKLIEKVFSATTKDYKKNIISCDKILNFANENSIIFLPSHDNENGKRLMNETEL